MADETSWILGLAALGVTVYLVVGYVDAGTSTKTPDQYWFPWNYIIKS